jgi:hypothetical protein
MAKSRNLEQVSFWAAFTVERRVFPEDACCALRLVPFFHGSYDHGVIACP